MRNISYFSLAMAKGPSPAKKGKDLTPVSKCTVKERVKQFPNELYADGGVLF